MGCEVSIQVHPELVAEKPAEPPEEKPEEKPAVATQLTRQDSMDSTVTIFLDESDFQGDI